MAKGCGYLHFYNLFLSPHSHIPSNIGIKDCPRSVRLCSTLGGILISGVLNTGDIEKTDGCKQAAALAEKF